MSGLTEGFRIFADGGARKEKSAVERLKARMAKGDWVSEMLVRKHGLIPFAAKHGILVDEDVGLMRIVTSYAKDQAK